MKFGYFFVIVIVFICGIVNAHDQGSVGAPLLHHPLGYSEIVWDDSDQFSRVFFVQYDMKGGDKFASQTNGAMLDMRHGKQCIVSGEMLFDIDDTFLYDIDEDIQLELTFDVSHSTGFVVSDSGVTHRADGPKHIRSFKVLDKSPWLEPAGVFAECTAGIFDGFRLDDTGNVWSSAEDGVHCLSPEGKLLGKIRTPESISNLTFGGLKKNRLFLCGTYSTFAVFVNVRGATTPRRGSK